MVNNDNSFFTKDGDAGRRISICYEEGGSSPPLPCSLSKETSMDRILFDYCVEDFNGERYLTINTYINMERIFPKLTLNIFCLDTSLKKSGNYPLFVCECGIEGCGGVFKTPFVKVNETTIEWHIFQPQNRLFIFDRQTLEKDIRHLKLSLLHYEPSQVWKKVNYTAMSYVGGFLKSA